MRVLKRRIRKRLKLYAGCSLMLIVQWCKTFLIIVIATFSKLQLNSVCVSLHQLSKTSKSLKSRSSLLRNRLKPSLSNDMKSKFKPSTPGRLRIQSLCLKKSQKHGMTTQNGGKIRSLRKIVQLKNNRKSMIETWKMRPNS